MTKNRCESCGSTKFGLVRQRWFRFQFCSRHCKTNFLAIRKRQRQQPINWGRGVPEAGANVPKRPSSRTLSERSTPESA
jgi:hypothetical protein